MTIDELKKRLPKSWDAVNYDPAARAFAMLLIRGEDPFAVLDEAISHYSRVNYELQEKLKSVIERSPSPFFIPTERKAEIEEKIDLYNQFSGNKIKKPE